MKDKIIIEETAEARLNRLAEELDETISMKLEWMVVNGMLSRKSMNGEERYFMTDENRKKAEKFFGEEK